MQNLLMVMLPVSLPTLFYHTFNVPCRLQPVLRADYQCMLPQTRTVKSMEKPKIGSIATLKPLCRSSPNFGHDRHVHVHIIKLKINL